MSGQIERDVREHLEALGVPYKIIDIDPEFADTARFCERYGYPLDQSVNCILVASRPARSGTRHAWSRPPAGST
jgi:hypothetical protein